MPHIQLQVRPTAPEAITASTNNTAPTAPPTESFTANGEGAITAPKAPEAITALTCSTAHHGEVAEQDARQGTCRHI